MTLLYPNLCYSEVCYKGTALDMLYCIWYRFIYRVPTSSGKPGKSPKKVSFMEKARNLKKNLYKHGKIMEFCEIIRQNCQ